MFELQHILHTIAQKGSESPFDRYKSKPKKRSYYTKHIPTTITTQPYGVQLSLFQNR